MKGGNRSDFISQVDQLIAVRHGGEPERDEGGSETLWINRGTLPS